MQFGAGWICVRQEKYGDSHSEPFTCAASSSRNDQTHVAPALGSPPRAVFAWWGGGSLAGACFLEGGVNPYFETVETGTLCKEKELQGGKKA